MRHAVLAGLGAHLPERVVTNDDLSQVFDTSDEWISTRTGIRQRHVADPTESSLHLGAEAGRRALKNSGSDHVDAVVVATVSPDRQCPATAPDVAAAIGLPPVPAFDVGAACSGFVYGVATATGLISAGIAERILLIGTETLFRFTHPEDRNTAVIFGDGAGAAVLRAGEADEPGAFGPFDLGADGTASDLITINAGQARIPPDPTAPAGRDHFFAMNGRETYRRAVPGMLESSRVALEARGWSVDDVDLLVAHQANARIIHAVADRMGLPRERAYVNIDRVGNTSAASIPLALADAHADGTLKPGARVLLTAFGAGLTWGSTTLVWPELPAV